MAWDGFLKSLETDGGKLVVLLFMLLFLAAVSIILLITGHTPQEAGRQMLVGAISSLLGILYGYLKSSGPTK
jgi:4-hydroxybenzoate polyprenyltransferase